MSVGLSDKMNNLKLQVLFTVLAVWGIALFLTMSEQNKVSNKSIISVDNDIQIIYSEYTDDLQLIKSNSLAEFHRQLEIKQKQVLEEKRIAAEKLAEEKRIAEAKIKEEKRHAELVAKRDAKNKEKKQAQVASVSRGNTSNQNWIAFEATHYSAYCNTGCTGVTALGWDVSNTIYHNGQRVIAVDPNVIPLGSLVEVKTPYGSFLALAGDTGGAIDGHRVDILVENDNVANDLGRVRIQLRIIK